MGTKIIEIDYEAKAGCIYYIKKAADNKLEIWEAKAGRPRKNVIKEEV